MTHFADDLYLGGFLGSTGILPDDQSDPNPTTNQGVGPMGRIVFRNLVPATLSTVNLAVAQALTANTPMTLTAGAGITLGTAPDGSGSPVYIFDSPRCVSLSSTSNLSGLTFLVTMFDEYLRKQTQLVTGPSNSTVTTLKAAKSILSIVPSATSASLLSAGNSDIFGLPFVMNDAGFIISAKWANVLAQNAGTLVVADATSPATNLTGDPRGTYAQSGAASNGSRRLVIAMHLTGGQCGANATVLNALGVTPA